MKTDSKVKHIPGKWEAVDIPGQVMQVKVKVKEHEWHTVADIYCANGMSQLEIASLISAAPDLLEACKDALDIMLGYQSTLKSMQARRATDKLGNAIAKAEGR